MNLYKYRGNGLNTDLIFTKREIWLAKPQDLNDPCECSMHELAPEWVAKRIREMKEGQMSGALAQEPEGSPFLKAVRAALPSITDFDQQYEAFRAIHEKHFKVGLSTPEELFHGLEEQLNSLGVFSLSIHSEHPLMWSHYGEEHRGICLGFELRDLTPSTDPMRFLEVKYSDEIPHMSERGFIQQIALSIDENGKPSNRSSISLSDESVRTAISTKSKCWEYEDEWRYVEPEGNRTYPFPGPLVEVIFGFRCTPELRAHYTNLAKTNLFGDVRLCEMRRIRNSFRFERHFIGICASEREIAIAAPQNSDPALASDTALTYPEITALLDHDQFSRALPLIEDALEKDPESPQLWWLKGIALGYQLHDEEALHCFERSIQGNPTFFSTWYHKGVALTQLLRYGEAAVAYEEARKLNPSDPSTLYNLAIVLGHLNEPDDISRVRELLNEAEKHGHPRARNLLDELGGLRQDPPQPE